MAKWVLPEQQPFTIQGKIAKAMQQYEINVDEVLEAIDIYVDNKRFEADLYKRYLANDE